MLRPLILTAAIAALAGCNAFDDNDDDNDQEVSASRQDESMGHAGPRPPAASATLDTGFAHRAAGAGLMEVEAGRIGVERAASDEVRRFAQRMIDDHSKNNDQLRSVARREGIDLPTALTEDHRAMTDSLRRQSGANFDREFMRMMVRDHEKAIDLFERQAESGRDAELRDFAARTLPTLREHHRMAIDISTRLSSRTR